MGRETTMGGAGRTFGPTAWTVILKARDRKELGALVERYWKPCYYYIRRKGHDIEDAKDLTQGFFGDFIERDALARVTKTKGKFRSFLLACLEHYLSNEYDRRKALKRGVKPLSLDFEGAEEMLTRAGEVSPEHTYRREWAVGLINRALSALKVEMGPRFDALREYITAGQPGTLREVAEKLDLSESNVKVIIHRSRRRYRDLLKEEVARTVERKGEVDEELRELFAALA
ncbi:MAG TPA: sigma-70 family RNA polymerase sigma factor [Planctomycetota bacterium]|nr:sigma-70 family RNA polymerase sigma factor [Planctomycetota bacterium]